jgi:hypothetical protein
LILINLNLLLFNFNIILIDGKYLYEVRYIVVSGSEKRVEEKYIRLKNESIETEKRTVSVRGRCQVEHCPCFISDCGHVQELEIDLNINGNYGAILIKNIKEKLLNKEVKKNLQLKLIQDEKEKELTDAVVSYSSSININKQNKDNNKDKQDKDNNNDKQDKDKKIKKKSRISSIPIKNAGKFKQRDKMDLLKRRPQSRKNAGKIQNLSSLMSLLQNDRIDNINSNGVDNNSSISNNNNNSINSSIIISNNNNNINISSNNNNISNNNNKVSYANNIIAAKKLYNKIAKKSIEEYESADESFINDDVIPDDLRSMYKIIQSLDYNTTFALLEYSNEKLIEASEKCILLREQAMKYNKYISEYKQDNQELSNAMELKITLLTEEFDKLDLQTERSSCDIFDKAFKHLLVIKKIEKNTIPKLLQKIRNIKKSNLENTNNNIREEWRTERCDANEAINILHDNYYGYLLNNYFIIFYFIN